MNCKYCNNIFKTKKNIKIHQKKVKYCLQIQKKIKTKKKLWKALLSIALSFRNEEVIQQVIEQNKYKKK